MIKAIIFDMGGVMLAGDINTVYTHLAQSLGLKKPELILPLLKKYRFGQMSGQISGRDFGKILKDHFDLKLSIEEILELWRKAFLAKMKPNRALYALVEKLKAKYQVALFSDVSDLHMQINRKKGWYGPFPLVLLSCEEGLVKPQQEFYELLLKRLGLTAPQCVYIDDTKENLDMPQKLGFQTIHFQNNRKLLRALKKLDVKI